MTLTFFSVDAQTTDNKKQIKREFKNQGEQEDYWAEQLFEKDYSAKLFNKFNGDISINGDNFNYGDQTFQVINTAKQFNTIFSSGLFYPGVITGDTNTVAKRKQQLDTLSQEQRILYNLIRTDSLIISNFEEVKFLTKKTTQKRFRFWLLRKGVLNPTVCFIELTNNNANDKTDLTSFINGAALTFFKSGWRVI